MDYLTVKVVGNVNNNQSSSILKFMRMNVNGAQYAM